MKRLVPRKIKDLFAKLIKSNSSATELADGLAIGVFVAFLPIMGIQMYVSLILTRLFRKNSLIAMVIVWITNPFTAVPIYLFNIWVGNYLYKDPVSIAELYNTIQNIDLHNILSTGKDILIPLWIGSTIVGIVAAFASQKLCLLYYDRLKLKILNRWYVSTHSNESSKS
jgi:uncharacterized protein